MNTTAGLLAVGVAHYGIAAADRITLAALRFGIAMLDGWITWNLALGVAMVLLGIYVAGSGAAAVQSASRAKVERTRRTGSPASTRR